MEEAIERRFELATFSICVAMTAALPVILYARRLETENFSNAPAIYFGGLFFTIALFYRVIRPDPPVAGVFLALGHKLWAVFIVGALTTAGAGWRLPFIDADLMSIDHALGFDATLFSARRGSISGAGQILWIVYWITMVTVSAVIITLFVSGRRRRGAAVTFLFVATLFCAGLIGILLPAQGALVYQPLASEAATGLPPGAGVWYWAEFQHSRSEAEKVLDFLNLATVVTFPSFHVCMILIIAWGAYPFRRLRWPLAIFSVLTLLSIFPMGGHYLADAIGAVVVTALALAAARKLDGYAGAPLMLRRAIIPAGPFGLPAPAAGDAGGLSFPPAADRSI